MSRFKQLAFRLRALFRKEKLDADMAEEMRLHVEERTRRSIAGGMSAENARYAAQRSFGGVEQVKAKARDERGIPWLEELGRDLGFAARALRRTPGFTAVAITSLALGLALTASTFAVVNAYLLRSLPYPEVARLYRVFYAPPGQSEPRGLAAVDWSPLRDIVEVADNSATSRIYLHESGRPREGTALLVASDSIAALDLRAAIGRSLVAGDFGPGASPVALISHQLWRERFGSDPEIIGRVVHASAANSGETPTVYQIIGVLPPEFRYVREYARNVIDLATPLRAPSQVYMVRLQDGVPPGFAEQRITALVKAAATAAPDWRGARLESVASSYSLDLRPRLIAIALAAGLVLFIVAANVGVLTLLRAMQRQKEMAVRVALGAGRRHLARMLLAETGLICGTAFAAGLAMTAVTLRWLGPLIEARLGRPVPGGASALQLDSTATLLAGGAAVLVGLSLAFIPLLAPWQRRLGDALRSEARGGTDRPSVRRARSILLTLEVSASLALLVSCGLMIRSVVHLLRVDLGYATEQMVRARIQLPIRTYPTPDTFGRYYDRLAERLAILPGASFSVSNFVPFFQPPLRPVDVESGDQPGLRAGVMTVSDGYFASLGIGINQGRGFVAADRPGNEPVAIVSETLARQLAPAGSVLGRRIRATPDGGAAANATPWRTVVGVAKDVRQTYSDREFRDVYIPFAQYPSRFGSILVRSERPPAPWPEALREISAAIDPDVLIGPSPSMPDEIARQLAGPKFLMSLLTAFALFAAFLAILGLYGVTAYTVRQREREIAIRMAIGAAPRTVVLMFMKSTAVVLAFGIAGGLFGAAALSRILESQLSGVQRFDAWTLLAGSLFMAATGFLATWWPARSAAKVDPMLALRCE